ncbi:MAG: aminodeoxychorismate/anthranilate synthase component II [Lachnospiraceae bacterium]|nr:aminodeoxychorismate/anthranilate synthase component II [Lachnospiraceae bacterium]
MVLLIDNYDSFSYNLYQYVGELDPDIVVIRNDEKTIEQIREMRPKSLIISPGPGRPEDAGIIIEVIRKLRGEIPILGVCLGHQAICSAFGATITYASRLMHGKQSLVRINNEVPIFKGLNKEIYVARYHSLAVDETTIPKELISIAMTEDREVMGVMHRDYPIYGVQFHPESIMTPEGKKILRNFINL